MINGIRITSASAPLHAGCLEISFAHFAHSPEFERFSEYAGARGAR